MGIRKQITLSALTAVAALSVGFGATFAMFMGDDSIDVSITAARVSVTPVLSLTAATSKGITQTFTPTHATFANGNALSITSSGIVACLAPGDSFTLSVYGNNNSDIRVQARGDIAMLATAESLAPFLEVSHTGFTTQWTPLATTDATIDYSAGNPTGSITIEFPSSYESTVSDWNSKTLNLTIGYASIQGNADIDNSRTAYGTSSSENTGTVGDPAFAFQLYEPMMGLRASGVSGSANQSVSIRAEKNATSCNYEIGSDSYALSLSGLKAGASATVQIPYQTGLGSKPTVSHNGVALDPSNVTYDPVTGVVSFVSDSFTAS